MSGENRIGLSPFNDRKRSGRPTQTLGEADGGRKVVGTKTLDSLGSDPNVLATFLVVEAVDDGKPYPKGLVAWTRKLWSKPLEHRLYIEQIVADYSGVTDTNPHPAITIPPRELLQPDPIVGTTLTVLAIGEKIYERIQEDQREAVAPADQLYIELFGVQLDALDEGFPEFDKIQDLTRATKEFLRRRRGKWSPTETEIAMHKPAVARDLQHSQEHWEAQVDALTDLYLAESDGVGDREEVRQDAEREILGMINMITEKTILSPQKMGEAYYLAELEDAEGLEERVRAFADENAFLEVDDEEDGINAVYVRAVPIPDEAITAFLSPAPLEEQPEDEI